MNWGVLAFVVVLLLSPVFVQVGAAQGHESWGYLAAVAGVALTWLWARTSERSLEEAAAAVESAAREPETDAEARRQSA